MFERILLGTDGSSCALKAASAAAEVAQKFAARLTVMTVYHPSPVIVPEGAPLGYEIAPKIIAQMQDGILADTGRVIDGVGVASRGRKECGNPALMIAEVAAQERCDLIVLGSRGLSGVKSFLLGSVSDRVTHLAHCPVLIVR